MVDPINPTDKYICARIKMRRCQLGLSQENLAQLLGVTPSQIQKYENATNKIRAAQIHILSKELAVPVAYFFQDADQSPQDEKLADALIAASRDDHVMISNYLELPDLVKMRARDLLLSIFKAAPLKENNRLTMK